MESFFLKGIILGFCLAAPVGPIGILCIRRTLRFGRLSGLFSGLGAAFADTLYGAISAFGLTLISDFLISARFWLHLFGAFFLLYLGARTFASKSRAPTKEITHKTLLTDFFSTFFLTLANPLTILAFVAIFAGLGLAEQDQNGPILILGVFTGSTLWWLLLSEGLTLFKNKISDRAMIWINRVAGCILMAFGLAAIAFLY